MSLPLTQPGDTTSSMTGLSWPKPSATAAPSSRFSWTRGITVYKQCTLRVNSWLTQWHVPKSDISLRLLIGHRNIHLNTWSQTVQNSRFLFEPFWPMPLQYPILIKNSGLGAGLVKKNQYRYYFFFPAFPATAQRASLIVSDIFFSWALIFLKGRGPPSTAVGVVLWAKCAAAFVSWSRQLLLY